MKSTGNLMTEIKTDADFQRVVIERAKGLCERHRDGTPATVAHHVIHKGRSRHARHDYRNGVALCHGCHEMERTDRNLLETACILLTVGRGDFATTDAYYAWRREVKTKRVGIIERIK